MMQLSSKLAPAALDETVPLVSIIIPMYNEGDIIDRNLARVCDHMAELEDRFRWELILVNDGSRDATGPIAERFAAGRPNVYVVHHRANRGLGQSLRTGFTHARGRYVVTLDADLSYDPTHIDRLLEKICETQASIVIASPYMSGGMASNIPWLRRALSRYANRFLGFMVQDGLTTLTGMVRVYDSQFLHSINLRELGTEINPRIIQHARVLNAQIVEIPAHLNWPEERRSASRTSYVKLLREILSVLVSGFLLRPYLYFLIPGIALFAFSVYANSWMIIHVFEQHAVLEARGVSAGYDDAVAAAFVRFPHTFFIGGVTLMLAVQLIGLAVISLQNKLHFDELFAVGSGTYRLTNERKRKEGTL